MFKLLVVLFVISQNTFIHLFTTLHLRQLLRIYNRTTCNCQATIRITIGVIVDAALISVCLRDDLILGFCHSNLTLKTGRFANCARQPLYAGNMDYRVGIICLAT